jgi:hypothetical protein
MFESIRTRWEPLFDSVAYGFDLLFIHSLVKQVQVKTIVRGGEEAGLAIVATLSDVLRYAWQIESLWARHVELH